MITDTFGGERHPDFRTLEVARLASALEANRVLVADGRDCAMAEQPDEVVASFLAFACYPT
jgi:hypothetical protein